MAPKRVLVVDSREEARYVIDDVLRPRGYFSVQAHDGIEALEKAAAYRPDLIILEQTLPQKSGLEVIAELREAGFDIPVIMTTAQRAEDVIVQALRLGVVDYVIKPYPKRELEEAIDRALARPRREKPKHPLQEAETKRLQRRVRELSVLNSVGKAVASVLDLEEVLRRIVEAAVFLTGAEEGFLLLVDEETGELYMRAGQGLGQPYAQGFRVKVSDSLLGQVVQTGKPILVGGGGESQYKVKTGYLVRSLIHVPLKVDGRVIGVLSVDNKARDKGFTDEHLYLLSALADYAVVAIENARLYEHADRRAKELADRLKQRAEAEVSRRPALSAEVLSRLSVALESQRRDLEQDRGAAEALVRGLEQLVAEAEHLVARMRAYEAGFRQIGMELAVSEMAEAGGEGQAVAAVGSDETLPAILERFLWGVVLAGPEGRIQWMNEVACALLGCGDVDWRGRELREVCADPRWWRAAGEVLVQMARRSPGEGDGEEASAVFWVDERMIEARFRPWSLPGSEAWAGVVAFLEDRTPELIEQQEAEEPVIAWAEGLRTPLATILGYASLLLDRSLSLTPEERREYLVAIQQNVGEIQSRLAEQRVAQRASRIARRQEVVPTDPTTVLEEVVRATSRQREAKKQFLTFEVPDGLPNLPVDPDVLYQVFFNLMLNASLSTRKGGTVTVRGKVYAGEEGGYLEVAIGDEGGGLSEEEIAAVLDGKAEHLPEGLGIPPSDLATTRMLVESYGGRLWVESVVGEGSVFRVLFPTA